MRRDAAKERRILNSRNALQAYYYALNVIKGRWPEAEDIIKKNPYYACSYAIYVIKGRWPEAEIFIKEDPESACLYAINVIKGRWLEAERFIKKSDHYWDEYKSYICKECNGEGIIDYGIGGAEEECLTCFGKGFDPSTIARRHLRFK